MSVNSFAAARMICTRRSWRLTAAEIHAILYLAAVHHAGTTGTALLSEPFEAWSNGPVLPALEDRIEGFGLRPVVDVFGCAALIPIGSTEHESLALASDRLAGMSSFILAAKTTWATSAWRATYGGLPPGDEIALEALIGEFWARIRVDDGLFLRGDADAMDGEVDDVEHVRRRTVRLAAE